MVMPPAASNGDDQESAGMAALNAKFINQKAARLRQGAIRAMFDQAATMQNVISMGIGEPDMPTPDPVCRAGIQAIETGETHYTPNAGILSLRKKIAEKSTVHGLGYDPLSEIIVTNGGMGALSLTMMVALEDGDEVIIQDPQWLNYAKQVEYCGGVVVPVPVFAEDGFAMQADAIEKHITKRSKAIIVNSPNNPTGAVINRAALKQIAETAEKHDLLIISDEVYNTLIYDGIECASIAEFSEARDRTIVVNSFSKSFAMTGWRVGYAAGPANIIDRMVKLQENISACANAPGQYAAALLLPAGAVKERVRISMLYGARVILVDGTIDDCIRMAQQLEREFGWYGISTARQFNPYCVEGYKTIAYELCEQYKFQLPDWIVVPIGGGSLLSMIWRGFAEMREAGKINHMPRLLGVQADGCCPYVEHFLAGRPVKKWEAPNTIAFAIADVWPYDAAWLDEALADSEGFAMAVSDMEIRAAQRQLAQSHAILAEPSSAVTIAAVAKCRRSGMMKESERICCVISGNGIKDIAEMYSGMEIPVPVHNDLESVKSRIII